MYVHGNPVMYTDPTGCYSYDYYTGTVQGGDTKSEAEDTTMSYVEYEIKYGGRGRWLSDVTHTNGGGPLLPPAPVNVGLAVAVTRADTPTLIGILAILS